MVLSRSWKVCVVQIERVKGFAGIQVVVHSIDSRRLQSLGLLFIHKAQRAANLNRNLLLDRADGSGDFVDFPIQRTPTADDDAIALGLRGRRLSGAVDHLLLRHEVIAFDGGGGDRGLGTVMTVFLAGAALGVLQHLEANGLAEIMGSDGKGGLEEFQQLFVRSIKYALALVFGQRFVAQGFGSVILIVDHGALHYL